MINSFAFPYTWLLRVHIYVISNWLYCQPWNCPSCSLSSTKFPQPPPLLLKGLTFTLVGSILLATAIEWKGQNMLQKGIVLKSLCIRCLCGCMSLYGDVAHSNVSKSEPQAAFLAGFFGRCKPTHLTSCQLISQYFHLQGRTHHSAILIQLRKSFWWCHLLLMNGRVGGGGDGHYTLIQ